MPGLIVALITAAVSSTGFLAYRHPKAYARLAMPVFGMLAAALIFSILWNGSHSSARYVAIRGLNFERPAMDKVEAAINADEYSRTFQLIVFGTACYLLFLGFLPSLKKLDEPPDKKDRKERSEKDD